jgi:hypothetical protein
MTNREPYFECVFVVDRNEYRFHFRSPTPAEAEQHLRDALHEWGVDASGEVRILDGKGRVLLLSAYGALADRVRA